MTRIADRNLDHSRDRIRVMLTDDLGVIGWTRFSSWPRNQADEALGEQYELKGKSAHLFDIAILPAHQRKGLGKVLFADVLGILKRDGYQTLYARTSKQNTKAIIFNMKMGFRQFKEKDGYILWMMSI